MSLIPESIRDILLPREERSPQEIVQKLIKLGYLNRNRASDKLGSWYRDAVQRYQSMHGLTVDGEPGTITQSVMFNPRYRRCALPDVLPARSSLCKWPYKAVTVRPPQFITGMNRDQIYTAFSNAIAGWNSCCGLQLTISDVVRDIKCDSGRGRDYQLDGRNGTLAWSELPCGFDTNRTRTLQQMYDLDEQWDVGFLTIVAMHEIGHAIGIDHLRSGNLMAAIFDPMIDWVQAGDKAEGMKRYGDPIIIVPQPGEEPSVPTNPTVPTPDPSGGNGNLIGRRFIVRVEQELSAGHDIVIGSKSFGV